MDKDKKLTRAGGYEMLSIMPEVLNYVFLSHLGFLQGMDDKEDGEQQDSLTFHRWKKTVDDCRINSKHKGGACRWETKMN